MMMPELDGYGVLTTLRQDPSTATIPFIFLTAKSAKADFRQGMDMGADDYLTKPFTRAELLSAIVNRLEKQAALKKHLLSTQSATTASSPKMQLLEVYLQRVVKQDKFQEFELYYQPIVDIGSGKIIAAENVLIWQSPELGSVPSLEFIEVAEAKGLILPLENWVFTSICEQIKMWQYNLDFLSLTININVSSSLFYCPQFIEDISAILLQKKVAPERIEIEISESIVMQNLNRAIAILQKISALGVKIALDDFGIGYSSLTNLKELPLNTLKIGRYYIHNVNSNQEKAALTIAVMKMAHNLNLRVIAEGVDTEAELDFLRQNNCDAMQGFLLSRPLPAAELENFF